MSATHVERIPKGFHHLEVTVRNKFVQKYPSRAPHPPRQFVQAKDRIKRWNIVPGDKVRLMVGKPTEKYLDEAQGKAGGWKIYTVMSVDMERNRLYLDGLTNKRANPVQPPPSNLAELDEDTQRSWLEQKNWLSTRRPVNYSNVQLCIEDAGADSVFVNRIATSAPFYHNRMRRWTWHRYASKLSGEVELSRHASRDQVLIPWPKGEGNKDTEPGQFDTLAKDVQVPTLALGDVDSVPLELVPQSLRAPVPKDEAWANEYILNPGARSDKSLQAVMPLYLGDELSPRFSRAKMQSGFRVRREREEEIREMVGKEAVNMWEAGGRDKGLEGVLNLEIVGLADVNIRPRTRKDVREGAIAEFDAKVEAIKKANAYARAAGALFDSSTGQFIDGPKGKKIAYKRARKDRKLRKAVERLQSLTLKDAKNQVIPKELQAQ